MKIWQKHAPLGYLVAVASVALVLLFRLRFSLGDSHPFLMLLSAVMASAWTGGLGPGLLATMLGALGSDFFLIPPYHSVLTSGNTWPVVVFLSEGAIVSTIAEAMRRANGKARQALLTRDEIMAVLAHDLRNPLSAVIGYSALLREMVAGGEAADPQMLEAIERSGTAMNTLIANLLDAGRVESGRVQIDRAEVNILSLCESVVEMVALQAKEKRLQLIPEGGRDAYLGAFDQGRLLQVFMNLLGNALKFTPPGGSVIIRLAAAADEILVSVSDTGPGIAAEDIPRIFQRHWQSSRAAKSQGSLGLGLYIAKGIVEAHGGRIGVKSREGQGSIFWVALPRQPGLKLHLPNRLEAGWQPQTVRPS